MPSRRKTREFVLQVLFAADAQEVDPLETLEGLATHFRSDQEESVDMGRVLFDFASRLVSAVSRDRKEIDELISSLSHHWKLQRMNRVDLNILRMAVAELTGFPEIPDRVTLNEAVELAKRYGTENSPAFVNGILDRIRALCDADSDNCTPADLIARLDESSTKG